MGFVDMVADGIRSCADNNILWLRAIAPKMMMVREETSSHYYFYYSYTRRSRSRSRSRRRRRTGRKAGVVRTHTHGTRMPVASARPSSLSSLSLRYAMPTANAACPSHQEDFKRRAAP